MNKAINGNGWAFTPAADGKPAMWAGKESVYNIGKKYGALMLIAAIGAPVSLVMSLIATDAGGSRTAFVLAIILGLTAFVLNKRGNKTGEFIGSEWQLLASGVGLRYSGDSSWSVSLDEIARIESGQTVEWQKVRDYGSKAALIPDTEMQVFIFTSDGRRLVVHTANAAREDCGRLAHSIRAYVETQRGNAAPSPSSSDTSSPAADGFDL